MNHRCWTTYATLFCLFSAVGSFAQLPQMGQLPTMGPLPTMGGAAQPTDTRSIAQPTNMGGAVQPTEMGSVAQPTGMGSIAPPANWKYENKWFNEFKGYQEALELQKQTGADIFLYFVRFLPEDEKGLCHWFETRGLAQLPVAKLLRDYLKVKVTYPLSKDAEAAMADFKVTKCPAVYIIKTDGHHNRCMVFEWPGGKPELLDANKLVELFRSKSDARYQLPAK